MSDLVHRPSLLCEGCSTPLGVPAPPAGVEGHAVPLRCPRCGYRQQRAVWIADAPAAEKILDRDPPPSPRWPDDPEEERRHGPTVERREVEE